MNSRLGWLAGASLLLVAGLIVAVNYGLSPGVQGVGEGSEQVQLVLYCAAGMRKPVAAAADDYQREYGVQVEIEYGGSGALLSQIRAAERGDLYLAADRSYFDRAAQWNLIDEVANLARQRAVLAVRRDDPQAKQLQSLEDVLNADLRIVLASPEVAAISRTAREALQQAGSDGWNQLWQQKLASVDTVNLVANHLITNVADVGVIWDSTARQYPQLRTIRVPALEDHPQNVGVAVLRSTKQPTEALRFLRYLSARDKGLKHFQAISDDLAEGDVWSERPELLVFAGGLNRPAIEKTIDAFEQREGVSVTDSYNGCGALVGQMLGGARPDLYFACDVTFMEQVTDRFPQSINVSGTDMVMISRTDLSGAPIAELADLAREGLKVGVCSPKQSALGFLTRQLLERHSLWDEVHVNVRDEPPTADVLVAKVVAGGLDAAIVYRANTTRQAAKLKISDIADPRAFAIQPIAVAEDSDHRQLATRLMDRIRSAESEALFRELGFEWQAAAP